MASNSAGVGAFLDTNADYNMISQSTMAGGSPSYAFLATNAHHNTIKQSYITNPSGDAAYVSANANFNTITQSTMTTSAVGYYGLVLSGVSSNTITQSYMNSSAGIGVDADNANDNTISLEHDDERLPVELSVALWIHSSASNTVTQSYVANPSGTAAKLDINANFNTISFQHDVRAAPWATTRSTFPGALSSNTIAQSFMTSPIGLCRVPGRELQLQYFQPEHDDQQFRDSRRSTSTPPLPPRSRKAISRMGRAMRRTSTAPSTARSAAVLSPRRADRPTLPSI